MVEMGPWQAHLIRLRPEVRTGGAAHAERTNPDEDISTGCRRGPVDPGDQPRPTRPRGARRLGRDLSDHLYRADHDVGLRRGLGVCLPLPAAVPVGERLAHPVRPDHGGERGDVGLAAPAPRGGARPAGRSCLVRVPGLVRHHVGARLVGRERPHARAVRALAIPWWEVVVTDFEGLRCAVSAGDGVVARFPGVVCVMPAPDQRMLVLIELCQESAGSAPGRLLARRIASWLGGMGETAEELIFGTVASTGDDGLAVFLTGPMRVLIPDLDVEMSGTESAAWTDRLIARPDTSVVLTAA